MSDDDGGGPGRDDESRLLLGIAVVGTMTVIGGQFVVSPVLPEVIETQLGEDVASFLADYGLEVGSVDTWLTHPGGPRVIEAFEEALGLDSTKTDVSRKSLRSVGNLSSASVLHVLESAWGTLMRVSEQGGEE